MIEFSPTSDVNPDLPDVLTTIEEFNALNQFDTNECPGCSSDLELVGEFTSGEELLSPADTIVPELPLIPQIAQPAVQSLPERNLNYLIDVGLETAKAQLKELIVDPSLANKLTIAFGEQLDIDAAKSLIQNLANGKKLPGIEVLPADDLIGVQGAFDAMTNTAYLSREFLAENANNLEAIAKVLLEEISHSIDAQVNTIDASGDEGAIFAALVQGEELSQSDISALQAENDQAVLSINGQDVLVENSSLAWTMDVFDWNWNWKGGESFPSNYGDGLNGVDLDWGNRSVYGREDYFIVGTWTQSYFDADKTYKFRVAADDGFQLFISRDGNNWTSLTSSWENAYRDRHDYNSFNEYSFTPSASGNHYVYAYVYEKEGDAYLDISWDEGWDNNKGGLDYSDFNQTVQYMYEEMRDNARSDEVEDIRWNNRRNNDYYTLRAYQKWADLVKGGADWDHKGKIDNRLGLEEANDYSFPIWGDSRHEYSYDIWSNIHYGYVGKAAGFTNAELRGGAYLNDIINGNRDSSENEKDDNAVELGIELWYETDGDVSRLTPELLRQKIVSNGGSLSRTDRIVNGE